MLPGHHGPLLLLAALAYLVRTDPFPLDGPRAGALVRRIVACEVAVLDEPAAGMPTREVNDLELEGVSHVLQV